MLAGLRHYERGNETLETRVGALDPPEGFHLRIGRVGAGKGLISRDLYSAVLHALLHYSLASYEAHAYPYTTRGSEPPGQVMAYVLPFATPAAFTAQNSHMAWGLYRSVIAFNNPDNWKESSVTIFIEDRRVALIRYLHAPQVLNLPQDRIEGATTSLSSGSASQMLQPKDNATMSDAIGYRLHWILVRGGETLRRETVYDTVAHAILWTAPYLEDVRFTGRRSISVPGGRMFVRLESFQIGHWDPLTYGFAATVVKAIPKVLEAQGKFEEAFFQILTPDNRVCGTVGIFIRDSIQNLQTIEGQDSGGVETA
ncbi:MAG: hypothetical protein Q9172_004570 [Xanthocarpia lactea]